MGKVLAEVGLRPERIVTLIDDVYDMYVRLARRNEIFDIEGQISQSPELCTPCENNSLERLRRYGVALGLVVRTLLQLLVWREHEILTASGLGQEFNCEAIVLAVKHPVETAAAVVCGEHAREKSILAYISHSISRYRKEVASDKKWPSFVGEFNEFLASVGDLSTGVDCRCIPILPTAIDEFRLRQRGDRFLPALRPR